MNTLTHVLRERIVAFASEHHAPPVISYAAFQRDGSVEVGTLRDGEVWLEPDQALGLYRVASLTKSFTAAAVLRLRDNERLALDDPAARYVAEIRGWPSDPTLRELLTMTAGLPTDNPWADALQDISVEDFRRRLAEGPPAIQLPKGTFEYSNLGYAILGLVIAEVANTEYDQVISRWFLAPLDMDSSTFWPDPVDPRLVTGYSRTGDDWLPVPPVGHGAFSPIGGLISTASDIAKWATFLSAGFAGQDRDRILSHQSKRQMQTIQAVDRNVPGQSLSSTRSPLATGYGFGLRLRSYGRAGTFAGHAGGYPGFGSHMWWHSMSGAGVVILANATYLPVQDVSQGFVEEATHRHSDAQVDRITPWLSKALNDVDRLIDLWSDGAAVRCFSHNLQAEESLAPLREEIAGLQKRHGRFGDPFDMQSDGPAHVGWRRSAVDGAVVVVDVLLSPEPRPQVQQLHLNLILDLDQTRRELLLRLVGALDGGSSAWPTLVETSPDFTRARTFAAASILYGPVELGQVTSNSENELSVVLISDKAQRLLMTIGFDEVGRVETLDIVRTETAPVEGSTDQ